MPTVIAAVVALATVAYPFAVYLSLDRWPPHWIAVALVLLALARAWTSRQAFWLVAAGGAALLGAASALGHGWMPLKLYPVLVNAVMFTVFAASLLRPPTVIERLARLSHPDLPPEGVSYTRRVTQVWCGFFALNGAVALVTALWMSTEAWTLYNGLIAYALMGLLFGGEWLVRRRVQARLAHG